MCLRASGFPPRFFKRVRKCISNSRFPIVLMGHFKGGKGLRQGNPISPYLL